MQHLILNDIPACNYLLKVDNKNTGKKCEICSKLTIKTPERRHWCVSGDCSRVSMIKSEYVIAG